MRRGKRTVRISNAAAEIFGESPPRKEKSRTGKSGKKAKANNLKDPLALPKKKSKTILVPTKAARKQPAEPEVYEVEKIINHKVTAGRTYYRIRWKGWSAKDDTWQQERDLNCAAILKKYKSTMYDDDDDDEDDEPLRSPAKKKKPGHRTAAKSPKKSPAKSPAKKGVASGKVTKKGRGRPRKTELASAAKRSLTKKATGKKRGRKPNTTKEWEVEEVVAVRTTKAGKEEFLIKWKGFGSDDNTWEPAKNVENCGEAIERFRGAEQNGNADSVEETTNEAEDAPTTTEEPADKDMSEVVVQEEEEEEPAKE